MCGITGTLAFNIVGRMHLVHLERATRTLEKRGPDVHNTWFYDNVGLGHKRLSIIDTSELGNQPFFDDTKRYVIVYNGEIYNFQELRKNLTQGGVEFRSESDTEVLLKLFILEGADCLKLLNGFFSFAVYDKNEQTLFLARDRFGIKPLYYYQDDDKFIFASELKSILAYGIKKEIDNSALFHYFQLTYLPLETNILKGINKVKPGHYLKVSKDGGIKQNSFYQLNPQVGKYSEGDAQIKLRTLMEESVRRRMIADVPLGGFLSGGIDSSVIAGLASSLDSSFKTFSIGFDDNTYFDETYYAELVAKHFGTEHQTFRLKNDDLLNHVNDIVDYIDEPFADSSSIPVYILSKLSREHIKVALSGDGADEIFSGYNKHSAWALSQESNFRNKVVSKLLFVWKLLPKSRYAKITDRFRQLEKFARILNLSPKEKYWFLASFIPENTIAKMLKYDQSDFDSYLAQKDFILKDFGANDLNEVLRKDVNLVLQGDMLRKVDLMSMANGLEVRVPFLDHEVVDFAFSLEESHKLKGKSRKIILRETFKDFLPNELYNRPKHGFEVPLMSWFKRELKSDLQLVVFNRDFVEEQGLFHWEEIRRIKRQLYSLNPSDAHIKIWSLFVFQKWYRNFYLN